MRNERKKKKQPPKELERGVWYTVEWHATWGWTGWQEPTELFIDHIYVGGRDR